VTYITITVKLPQVS